MKDLQMDASKQLFKKPSIPEEIANYKEEINISELLGDLTLARLQSIFHAVMKKQIDKIDPIRSKFGKIEKEKISLGDRMQYISEYAREHKKFNFRMLLEEQTSKTMVIVSFLGILELMKEGMLKIVQENIFDDIWITYQEGEG